jgi:hypothetical protein
MIGRFSLALPFEFAVPKGAEFPILGYHDGACLVREYPPVLTDVPLKESQPISITLDGVEGMVVNGLRIDFVREAFDRSQGIASDPPEDFMIQCAERLLSRLRFISGAAHAPVHVLRSTPWSLQYLNDDESEFESAEGLVRKRGHLGFRWAIIGLTPTIWSQMVALGPTFEPPVWHTLLLDAQHLMPNIGAAVTLASTALEVFGSHVVNQLATMHSTVPREMWSWINYRGNDFSKHPSVEEQFDNLLKTLCGHSLKEQGTLWIAFQHLRQARNSFVHTGTATIGKKKKRGGVRVTDEMARQLIASAVEITTIVRGWLPEELRWPKANTAIDFKFVHTLAAMFPSVALPPSQLPPDVSEGTEVSPKAP